MSDHRTSTASTANPPPTMDRQMIQSATIFAPQRGEGGALVGGPTGGCPTLRLLGLSRQHKLGAQRPHFHNKTFKEG